MRPLRSRKIKIVIHLRDEIGDSPTAVPSFRSGPVAESTGKYLGRGMRSVIVHNLMMVIRDYVIDQIEENNDGQKNTT